MNSYIFLLLLVSAACIGYACNIFIKIKKFDQLQMSDYYTRIDATFSRYAEKTMSPIINIFGTQKDYFPVFTYMLNGEENIIRSKYKVKEGTYQRGQKVNCIYQDPKTEKVFENPANGSREAKVFLVIGIIILLFTIYVITIASKGTVIELYH